MAESATATSTPAIRKVRTDVASKVPSPPGTIPIVRNRLAIMKLANTPLTERFHAQRRISDPDVAASSSTMAPCRPIAGTSTRGLRTNRASAPRERERRLHHLEPCYPANHRIDRAARRARIVAPRPTENSGNTTAVTATVVLP